MERLTAWIRRFYSKHWQEGVVLIAIICLDYLGWLPRIVPDIGATSGSAGSAVFTRGVCLLVGLTVIWALADQFLSRDPKQDEEDLDVRRSA